MRIRMLLGAKTLVDLRMFESALEPAKPTQPVEPDRNSMGMPSAERAQNGVRSRGSFGFGSPQA